MTTRAVKRKRDDRPDDRRDWEPPNERAPSIIRKEQFGAIRVIAVASLVPTAVGAMALIMSAAGRSVVIGPGWGFFLLMVGVAGLLLHAFGEKELMYRRAYGIVAAALGAAGVLFSLLKAHGTIGGFFLPIGAPCIGLAWCFALSFARNEDDEYLKTLAIRIIGIAGAAMVATGFVGGLISDHFLLTRGVIYLIFGLLYIASFVGLQRIGSEIGYWAGWLLGAVGAVMIVLALGRSLPFDNIPVVGEYLLWINDLFAWIPWRSGQPGAPFLFTYMGIEFLLLSIGICSDSQLVTLTRRELSTYFYSPIAYIVIVALALMGWVNFFIFISILTQFSGPDGMEEPIFPTYMMFGISLICVVLMVPIITMRVFSEESRGGTLEVLLTAPVKESTVVISKFLAAWRFYLLAWYPWLLYLVALLIEGGEEFDYRPVLTFFIVLAVTGAGFVAMGTFLSSLTRNQIISAILTLLAMIALLSIFILQLIIQRHSEFWSDLLRYVSFHDLWNQSAQGILAPRYMLFHISAAVFWLFLTVKVLESRKWR